MYSHSIYLNSEINISCEPLQRLILISEYMLQYMEFILQVISVLLCEGIDLFSEAKICFLNTLFYSKHTPQKPPLSSIYGEIEHIEHISVRVLENCTFIFLKEKNPWLS